MPSTKTYSIGRLVTSFSLTLKLKNSFHFHFKFSFFITQFLDTEFQHTQWIKFKPNSRNERWDFIYLGKTR